VSIRALDWRKSDGKKPGTKNREEQNVSKTAVASLAVSFLLFFPFTGFSVIEYEKSKCASFVFRGTIKTFCSQDPLDPFEEEMLVSTLKHIVRGEGTPDKSHIEISRSPEPPEVDIRFFDGLDRKTTYARGRGKDLGSALRNLKVQPSRNE
jgi:hypothetical protein